MIAMRRANRTSVALAGGRRLVSVLFVFWGAANEQKTHQRQGYCKVSNDCHDLAPNYLFVFLLVKLNRKNETRV